MNSQANDIQEIADSDLTEPIALQIATLAKRSFESSRTLEERLDEMMNVKDRDDPEFVTGRRYLKWHGEQLVAHARTFIRKVFVEEQLIQVLALATVCSDPDLRGKGLGAEVTRAAFQLVGQTDWPGVSLFQTPVPKFYEKLNSRTVDNRFVNRLNEKDPDANPWRDDIIMIYPSEYEWPAGIVNLNGPDY